MPQFHLNDLHNRTLPKGQAYDALSDFAKGYVEAMFFTNGDTGLDEENTLNDLGVMRLTRASIETIARDCDKFLGILMPDGCFARQWIDRLVEADERPKYGNGCDCDERAGNFFWYARQGHGVAWTDDYSPSGSPQDEIAEGLQNACRRFGECYVEVSRGWIYVR